MHFSNEVGGPAAECYRASAMTVVDRKNKIGDEAEALMLLFHGAD